MLKKISISAPLFCSDINIATDKHKEWHVESINYIMHQHIPCRRIIWHIVSHNHQYNTDGFRYVKRDYSIHDFRISLLNHLAQDLVLHRTISVPDKYLSLAVISVY